MYNTTITKPAESASGGPNKLSWMSNSSGYSKILKQAYEQFILKIGDKDVPMPHRINIPPEEHPARQGKSSPEVIFKQLKIDAEQQNFDLNKASVEEIKHFMKKNKLGIDCSGFAYRMLNHLVQQIKGEGLETFGFPHVGRTNVNTLTSEEFSIPIKTIRKIHPGDIIKTCSEETIPHCAIVIEKTDSEITYAHSSNKTKITGVHLGKITINDPYTGLKDQLFLEETYYNINYGDLFNSQAGDNIVRLKILN